MLTISWESNDQISHCFNSKTIFFASHRGTEASPSGSPLKYATGYCHFVAAFYLLSDWCMCFIVIWRRAATACSPTPDVCRAATTLNLRLSRCEFTGAALRHWRCWTTEDELSRCRVEWNSTEVLPAIYRHRRRQPTRGVVRSVQWRRHTAAAVERRQGRRRLAAPWPASALSKVTHRSVLFRRPGDTEEKRLSIRSLSSLVTRRLAVWNNNTDSISKNLVDI